MGKKPLLQEVDRLRALSPLSRNLGMSSLRSASRTHRGIALTNGSLSRRNQATVENFRTPCAPSRVHPPIRTIPLRPTRGNTAPTSSPRKVSAPCKLISAIGKDITALPESVTLRRKVSAPARTTYRAISRGPPSIPITRGPVSAPLIPCTVSESGRVKKSSAPARLHPTQDSRISKDHCISQQSSPNLAPSASSGADGKASKKGSPSYSVPELTPVKEERKLRSKFRKMSAGIEPGEPRAQSRGNPLDDLPRKRASLDLESPTKRQPQPQEGASIPNLNQHFESHLPQDASSKLPSILFTSATSSDSSQSDFLLEKVKLERTVSDLIKNIECKKQEIAALKMEINRLKEAVRDRLHATSSNDDSGASKQRKPSPQADSYEGKQKRDETRRLESLIDSLSTENRLLRDHLKQLGVPLDSSPLSDQQKMLLSGVSAFSQSGGENASCGDRDWDNKSSSSISEISVACLQGRIQQMEETHYSTHEELQATLQELDDLREQFSECHIEVEQLQEEKQVILESLTQQTEKLNEARSYNDTLKLMLIQQSENSEEVSQCEKTQRLMELLKSVQEDRELVQIRQEDLDKQMQASKQVEEHFQKEAQLIRDRMKLLESMVEAATSEKQNVESQLMEAQEVIRVAEKETRRLKSSLAIAKEKITEMETAVISGEDSELADVLERVCAEKEIAEKEVAVLQKRINLLTCENEKLKDQVATLQDSLRVTRNNAKTNLDDLEWQKTQLDEKRKELEQEIEALKVTLSEVQMTCQHHLEDKRELKASLCESQKKFTEMLDRQSDIEKGFAEERKLFNRQVEEWDQFQKDLLTSVRVANDFKTEAQHNLERFQRENQLLKERLRQLDLDLERARSVPKPTPPIVGGVKDIGCFGDPPADRRVFRSVSQVANGESILADKRNNSRPLARGDSRVKSLIESIECATKSGSRSSSTSSLTSNGSETNNNNNMKTQLLKRADTESIIRNLPASPLKECVKVPPLRALNCNSITDSLPAKTSSNLSDTVKMSQLSGEKTSSKYQTNEVSKPLSILSHKIDPMRKSSYGQLALGDKKDPLASLAQGGGSKRNALLKWCQNKILGYSNVDITNFSSSWNDGLAFCALLDSYLPEKINYKDLNPNDKRRNFEIAFDAAENIGIPTLLDINDMIISERPSWQLVFNYVTSIYTHFET